MATEVVMPKLSPTMEEGQLARWLKKEGEKVSMGEPIAEIDTDKATMEMQALSAGVLRKIIVHEGESVPLGQPIAIIGEPDEDISELLNAAKTNQPAPRAAEETSKLPESDAAPAIEQKDRPPVTSLPTASTSGDGARRESATSGRLLVSPIAARMAAEAGVKLDAVKGSGPGGRIVKRDIEDAMSSTKAPATGTPKLRPVPTIKTEKGAVYGPSAYRDEPMSEMRRTIARRLVTSLGPVPHFFL